MAVKAAAKHDVRLKVQKAADLETHLRIVDIDGTKYVEVRDYIISSKEYGRGYWLPLDKAVLSSLSRSLAEIAKAAG